VAASVDALSQRPASVLGRLLGTLIATGRKGKVNLDKAQVKSAKPGLLDDIVALCGWKADHGLGVASQRAAISILAVCGAAAPAQCCLRLGVPGLSRVLMFAQGLFVDPTVDVAATADPTQGATQAATQALHLQEAAVAALGHLSRAAAAASKAYKPQTKAATASVPVGAECRPHHHHHHHHHHQQQQHQNPGHEHKAPSHEQKGETPRKPADLAGLAASAAERPVEERLVTMFQRFVSETGCVDRLSNLRKAWEAKAAAMKAARSPLKPSVRQSVGQSVRQSLSPEQAAQARAAAMHAAEMAVYRGMVKSATAIIVNLNSLPPEEVPTAAGDKSVLSEQLRGDGAGAAPVKAAQSPQQSARGKVLLRKLQGGVLPRDRVKKVIELIWSDRRETAEQGCASLWLLCREPGPRSVVVDMILQISGGDGRGLLQSGRIPILPRLHGLIVSTPSMGLRCWALSAIWILLEDRRFRELPFTTIQLLPLLVSLVNEYAPLEPPQASLPARGKGSPRSPRSARSSRSLSLSSSSSGSSGSSSSSSSGSESESDDERKGSPFDPAAGLDMYEARAVGWKSLDLKRHGERQRLAGVALGALVSIAYHHTSAREALQRSDVRPARVTAFLDEPL